MSERHGHRIEKRDLRFDLSAVDLERWHPEGAHVSHYFNVQSLLFPQGERFFIRSVRRFQDCIDDPVLRQQVAGFIAQEAMHGREHDDYNAALARIGYRVDRMERFLERSFRRAQRWLSGETRLAMTVALEHLTAIGAATVLADARLLAGAQPQMAQLWRWHAAEETDHKAVAFDVYRTVAGSGSAAWLRRCLALLCVSASMQAAIWIALTLVLARRGQLFDLKGWWRLIRLLWVTPGAFRREIPGYFRFFKPGFHPWDVDNYDQVLRWEEAARQQPSSP